MILSSFPRQVDIPASVSVLSEQLSDAHVVHGLPHVLIRSVGSPEECDTSSLIFLRPQPIEELQKKVDGCRAGVLIVNQAVKVRDGQTALVTDDPLAVFIKSISVLFKAKPDATVHETAVVSPSARIGSGVSIGAYSVIESGVTVESDCSIGTHCFIGGNTYIAEGTVIQNNVSIGGVGLGFHFEAGGQRLFFPHLGAVRIGTNAVIGSGCVIVRGQLSDTVIGTGSRLGNMVNVGHNVRVGEKCSISSGTVIAGGAHIGDDCHFGVGASVNSKVRIANNCIIGMATVVTKSLPLAVSVFGNPARPLPTMNKF